MEEKAQLHQVIQSNVDVFAWTHADMPGISLISAQKSAIFSPIQDGFECFLRTNRIN